MLHIFNFYTCFLSQFCFSAFKIKEVMLFACQDNTYFDSKYSQQGGNIVLKFKSKCIEIEAYFPEVS